MFEMIYFKRKIEVFCPVLVVPEIVIIYSYFLLYLWKIFACDHFCPDRLYKRKNFIEKNDEQFSSKEWKIYQKKQFSSKEWDEFAKIYKNFGRISKKWGCGHGSVTVQFLKGTLAVPALEKLFEDNGYFYEWFSGQESRLTKKKGKTLFTRQLISYVLSFKDYLSVTRALRFRHYKNRRDQKYN